MCGGGMYQDSNENEIEMPKTRTMAAIAKDGTIQIRNNGYAMFVELVDTETEFTKEQQEADFEFDNGFTKAGNPIISSDEISAEAGAVLLRVFGVKKPRKGQTVKLG